MGVALSSLALFVRKKSDLHNAVSGNVYVTTDVRVTCNLLTYLLTLLT